MQRSDLSACLGEEYEDVVKKNACITLHISKCTTIGPPRVGKTCLKYLLTGRKWDKHKGTSSTDVMEAPEWVEVHRESGEDTLECLSRDKCKELLMNDVAAGDFDYMQPKNKDETANNNPKPSKVREPQGKPEGKHASSLVVSSAAIECLEESLKHDDFQEQLQEAKRAQEEFHKAGRESTSMRAMKFLHFIDTGGQRIYHDVHPVLITSPSVYLVVINLVDFAVKHDILPPQTPHSKSVSEALYSRNPEVLDTTESPKVPTRHSKDLDAMELAEHALRSIYTFTTKSPGESEAAEEGYLQIHPKRPKVFIIGTHLDLIHSNDPEERKKCLKELNGKIVQMVKAKAYTRFIQYDDQDCCLWAVDNTLAGHREEQKKTGSDKYLQLFRGLILEESMMFEVTVPIKWQLFEHLTSQQSHFGYNELLQFACSRKFCDSKREFQLMLEVFHILGLYFFKIPQGYEAQSGIVFTKPNVLYKATSELLWAAVDHVQSTGERLIDAKAVLQGLIAEEKVIKIDVNWFICLLCDLRLMAKLSNSASKQHLYVIPAALPISERAKGALQFSVSPLLVTFTSPRSRVSFLPSGLFCALMSDLLGQSRYTPHRDKLYRNCIVLSVPGQDSNVTYGELYISEKEFFIEITFRTTPSCSFTWVAEIAEICMAIRDYLEQRIGIVWRKIYEEHNFLEVMEEIQSDDCREAIIWGFPCHFHPEGAHIAKYLSASQGSCARCLDPRSSLIGAVFDSQCVWFSKLNGQLSFKDGVLVVPDKNVHTVPQQDTPMECT
jgi:GTPase SAR1 family protein